MAMTQEDLKALVAQLPASHDYVEVAYLDEAYVQGGVLYVGIEEDYWDNLVAYFEDGYLEQELAKEGFLPATLPKHLTRHLDTPDVETVLRAVIKQGDSWDEIKEKLEDFSSIVANLTKEGVKLFGGSPNPAKWRLMELELEVTKMVYALREEQLQKKVLGAVPTPEALRAKLQELRAQNKNQST